MTVSPSSTTWRDVMANFPVREALPIIRGPRGVITVFTRVSHSGAR